MNDAKLTEIAFEIFKLSRNILTLNLRFLDSAISRLKVVEYDKTIATDGVFLFINPKYILLQYKEEQTLIAHDYLHTILHLIFYHRFSPNVFNQDLWNLACDITIAAIIEDLDLNCINIPKRSEKNKEISRFKDKVKILTADKIYRYLVESPLKEHELKRLSALFLVDDHSLWEIKEEKKDDKDGKKQSNQNGRGQGQNNQQNQDDNQQNKTNASDYKRIDQNENPSGCDSKNQRLKDFNSMSFEEQQAVIQDWRNISEHTEADLKSFSNNIGNQAGSLIVNLESVNKEKYDYTQFLKKFCVLGESMEINDDEFDYIYYTFGLKQYDNMPLVEPLEYKDVKKIKEFVIAIDTSGSVYGELVQKFLTKTYNIIKQEENFFKKINLHIIQCDTKIQSDTKITNQQEFDHYIATMKLFGFGGTDFRPVFEYVEELILQKEFVNLKGLIYFTDGFGVFPTIKPSYNTAFVFIRDDNVNIEVPSWAIKLILDKDDI